MNLFLFGVALRATVRRFGIKFTQGKGLQRRCFLKIVFYAFTEVASVLSTKWKRVQFNYPRFFNKKFF